jgi:gamma-glutamyl:cysteine ligase YbdK (ATP-grasp superfamily)
MTLHLFEGYGIEIEYMIVDASTLAVLPIADALLREAAGCDATDVELGEIDWSNELSLHLIELKTHGPVPSLAQVGSKFQEHVDRIGRMLAPRGARLMPTAMHPTMDPYAEMRLWPHENNPIYEAYHRIFDCRGHGWANLQSVHLNLPFATDDELARLHAAARLILPIVPGLAASSPIVEGRLTGILDNRVSFYEDHVARVPSLMGDVIPEPVRSRAEYLEKILEPIYRDLAPMDPEGVLRDEWANARGAIARFDRMALELRLTDVQEHPSADLAVAALIAGAVRHLVESEASERWDTLESARLRQILTRCAVEGDRTVIDDADYLSALGSPASSATAGEVWGALYERVMPRESPERAEHGPHLEVILEEGVLARRIVRAVGEGAEAARIREVYAALCACLERGQPFRA